MLVSFYSRINNQFAYTGIVDEYTVLPHTEVVYNFESGFKKPIFDEVNQVWIEGATPEELIPVPVEEDTILSTLCRKYNIPFLLDTEIQFDNLSFLTAKEAVYGLKGTKLYKDYVYLNENGEEITVIRQQYNVLSEERRLDGLSTQAIVGLNKVILFYKPTQSPKEKVMKTLDFSVFPITTLNPVTGDPMLIYSSSKLEEFLEGQRYKADNMLKSFNPNLYNWLYFAYGDLYQEYLKTGNSSRLIKAFNTEADQFNISILDKVVEEQFLVMLLGDLPEYPVLKVKELIIMNLQ